MHHLPPKHAEAKRARTPLERKQVYEQCDSYANQDENPLASVRAVQRVLCRWPHARNAEPTEAEVHAAHAWFDSGWDNVRERVVSLDACVGHTHSGACSAAAACGSAGNAHALLLRRRVRAASLRRGVPAAARGGRRRRRRRTR